LTKISKDGAPLLSVRNLCVSIPALGGSVVNFVDMISFDLTVGSVTAMVGRSGSGKTLTAQAVMGLLHRPGPTVVGGEIIFDGVDLLALTDQQLQSRRGKDLSMIFQDPATHFDPVMSVGRQIAEPLRQHLRLSAREAYLGAEDLLNEVGFANPRQVARAFSHELSGGQQQRAMIAAAIAAKPRLLIADEPTSALDVTIQRQIIDLLENLRHRYNLTILLISHDLTLVGNFASDVIVMRNGSIVEQGNARTILTSPNSDYARSMVDVQRRLAAGKRASARSATPRGVKSSTEFPVLGGKNLKKTYLRRLGWFRKSYFTAVSVPALNVYKGETVGVVGESGAGKSTLAKLLVRLLEPSEGTIQISGRDVSQLTQRQFRPLRPLIQMIFQNPAGALNPDQTVREILMEPMRIHRIGADETERKILVAAMIERVGLSPAVLSRRPEQFSGGERQRIAIARCLTLRPSIIVCDECVSALDIQLQLQILDLLLDLQEESGIGYVFISHDLDAVRYMSDDIIVLKGGKVVEEGRAQAVFRNPRSSYAAELFASQHRRTLTCDR